MISEGAVHAFVPFTGTQSAALAETFACEPRTWLPEPGAQPWVSLWVGGRPAPARLALGPPASGEQTTSRTILLDPHGGCAAAPSYVGILEVRSAGRGSALVLRAHYRYGPTRLRPAAGHRTAHEAATRWLTAVARTLGTATAARRTACKAVHPSTGSARFGPLHGVPT